MVINKHVPTNPFAMQSADGFKIIRIIYITLTRSESVLKLDSWLGIGHRKRTPADGFTNHSSKAVKRKYVFGKTSQLVNGRREILAVILYCAVYYLLLRCIPVPMEIFLFSSVYTYVKLCNIHTLNIHFE